MRDTLRSGLHHGLRTTLSWPPQLDEVVDPYEYYDDFSPIVQLVPGRTGGAFTDAGKTTPAGTGDSIYTLHNFGTAGTNGDAIQSTAGSRPIVADDSGIVSAHFQNDWMVVTPLSLTKGNGYIEIKVVDEITFANSDRSSEGWNGASSDHPIQIYSSGLGQWEYFANSSSVQQAPVVGRHISVLDIRTDGRTWYKGVNTPDTDLVTPATGTLTHIYLASNRSGLATPDSIKYAFYMLCDRSNAALITAIGNGSFQDRLRADFSAI